MDWRTARLAALWALSAAPLVWPGSAERLAGASRMALAILPWLVASGMPRFAAPSAARPESPRRGWVLVPLALALPCAALGLRLDVASGFELRERLVVLGVSLALALLSAIAAHRAALFRGAGVRHAVAWLVLVPGLPLWMIAQREGGRPLLGEPLGALVGIAGASPLAWLWSRVAEPAELQPGLARAAGPVLVCIALWVASARGRTRNAPR